MPEQTMWRGVLTTTYIDKEREPGKTLLIVSDKIGLAHPDPNTAWEEAQDFLEEAGKERKKGEILEICIRPASYKSEGDDRTMHSLN
jgi:hypothetical protein